MKKIYLQPTMKVGAMMQLGLIAASKGNVVTNSYDNSSQQTTYGVSTELEGGDGTNFGAKDRGFYSSYDSEW